MSELAARLQLQAESIAQQWVARLDAENHPGKSSDAELRLHLPALLHELGRALRGASAAQDADAAALAPTRPSYRLGFDVDALLREFGALRECLLDTLETPGVPLTRAEGRILSDFLFRAMAEAVAEHRRRGKLEDGRASEVRLRQVLDALPVGVSYVTADARYGISNQANEDWFGIPASQLEGRRVREVMGEEVYALRGRFVEQALAGERVNFEAYGAPHPRGGTLDIRVRMTPLRDAAGALDGYVACAEDITSQKRVEREREALLVEVGAGRQRLEALMESAPAFVCTLRGPKHVYELVNPAYQSIVGKGRQLIGLPVARALPEVAEQGFLEVLDKVYRTGTAFVGSETAIHLDRSGNGTLEDAYLNFVYQPARNVEGEVEGIDVFGFDVTEQVLARRKIEMLARQLEGSEGQLRAITDELPVLVSVVTAEERYSFVNKAYEEWFGIAQKDLIGLKVREVIGEAAYGVLGPYVRRGIAGERFTVEQQQVPYRLGGKRDVRVTFTPHQGEDGGRDGYVAMLEDVTDEQALLAERDRALQRQSEFEQQLFGIAGHDLRNPLAAITLAANLLSHRENLDANALKSLLRIETAAGRATRLVNDMLDFTQARLGGGIRISRGAADFHELTAAMVEEVEVATPDRTLTFSRSGDGRGFWDADRLSQVVQNLVTNALKYGTAEAPVRVATKGDAGGVTLSVHNMGTPLAPERLQQIFQPMQARQRRRRQLFAQRWLGPLHRQVHRRCPCRPHRSHFQRRSGDHVQRVATSRKCGLAP